MAIEFYLSTDYSRKSPLFTIDDSVILALESVFADFKIKTGIYIDPYGTSNISSEHLNILNELLNNEMSLDPMKNREKKWYKERDTRLIKALEMFELSAKNGKSLVAEGD